MSGILQHGDCLELMKATIYPGDLVRSDHFRERLRSGRFRQHYLYHVIIVNQGDLEMVPASALHKASGGRCWLKTVDPSTLTIISGYGPENWMSHHDRPCRKREVPHEP